MFNHFVPVLSFRCAIQSGCAPLESGWMNTAGKREWSFINGGDGSHTAVREKIDPEEVTICTGHTRGTSLTCFIDFIDDFCRPRVFNRHPVVLIDCRHYLEARSLNQRIMFWGDHNMDIAYEEDSRDSFAKDRDRDWHHYSKSSGRSGRSGRSRRSSRRQRDRKHRRSHSRHRSASVWDPLSLSSLSCLHHHGVFITGV